jgi:hypothetical protein
VPPPRIHCSTSGRSRAWGAAFHRAAAEFTQDATPVPLAYLLCRSPPSYRRVRQGWPQAARAGSGTADRGRGRCTRASGTSPHARNPSEHGRDARPGQIVPSENEAMLAETQSGTSPNSVGARPITYGIVSQLPNRWKPVARTCLYRNAELAKRKHSNVKTL